MQSCNRAIVSVFVLLSACTDGPGVGSELLLPPGGIVVLPSSGSGEAGSTGTPRADGTVDWCCSTWTIPLPVQPGDAVSTVSTTVRDNAAMPSYIVGSAGDGGNYVTVSLVAQSASGATSLANCSTSPNTWEPGASGTVQPCAIALAAPHFVAQGETLILRASASALYPSQVMRTSWIGRVTVAGPAPAPSLGTPQTMQLPPGAPTLPAWNATLASGGIVTPLPLTNGSQIIGLRARIADVPGMTFTLSLQSVVEGVASTIATSQASSGTGVKQTLVVPGLSVAVASGTNYQAVLSRVTGSGLGSAYWIEVDTQ